MLLRAFEVWIGAMSQPETASNNELSAATVDICLLAMIESANSYGHELVQGLVAEGFPGADERAVYPVLGRLELDGLLEPYLVPSATGPARKYYRITPEGRRDLRRRAAESFDVFARVRKIATERVDLDGARSHTKPGPKPVCTALCSFLVF